MELGSWVVLSSWHTWLPTLTQPDLHFWAFPPTHTQPLPKVVRIRHPKCFRTRLDAWAREVVPHALARSQVKAPICPYRPGRARR